MSEHLNRLRRQKRLIEEHLNWLDQEIEAASGVATPPAPAGEVQPIRTSAPPAGKASSTEPSPPADNQEVEELSDQLISRYSHTPDNREMNPKVGCILYCIGALVFISAILFAIYWFGYR